jgi:hypothetical protein
MRLGETYFDGQLRLFALNPTLPFIFLMHAADVADFSGVSNPFFRENAYFRMRVDHKMEMLAKFLKRIAQLRQITTTEMWLETDSAAAFTGGS